MTDEISCYLVTGFLGSGKTTLLRGALSSEKFQDTVVIVNEIGEIALDNELIIFSADKTVVMPGGCLCCTIREDIEVSLRKLFEDREAGRIPSFNRIIIETTGIAEPVPLLMTLAANPLAQSRLNKPKVITVVDGVLGPDAIKKFPEAAAQVSSADVLVTSKVDLATDTERETLEDLLEKINPWAERIEANLLDVNLEEIFSGASEGDSTSSAEAHRWDFSGIENRTASFSADDHASCSAGWHNHRGISTHSIALSEPLDWTAFGVWMTLLLHRHGERILRVKGLLDVDRLPGPTLFQSSQHLVYPPVHMDEWPTQDRSSRLVFIVRDLDPELLRASLMSFNALGKSAKSSNSDVRQSGSGGTIAGRPIRRPTTPAWIRG